MKRKHTHKNCWGVVASDILAVVMVIAIVAIPSVAIVSLVNWIMSDKSEPAKHEAATLRVSSLYLSPGACGSLFWGGKDSRIWIHSDIHGILAVISCDKQDRDGIDLIPLGSYRFVCMPFDVRYYYNPTPHDADVMVRWSDK